jgi:hypothetical protein
MRRCKETARFDALAALGSAMQRVDEARELGAAGQVRAHALCRALRDALAAAERYREIR